MLSRKSYTCTHAKSILGHALTVWSIVKNSSFLLLYFFNLLLSFLFCVFPLSPFFEVLFVLYTMVFTPISPPTCESDAQSFCHNPNPKGSEAWERHLKVPVDFFFLSFLTIQSTKLYQVLISRIIIIIPLNILSD